MGAALLMALGLAWAQDCPNPDAHLNRAEDAVFSLSFAEVDRQLALAVEGWGCGELATSAQLHRYWMVGGARYTWDDQRELALQWLAAARRTDTDAWNDDYDDDVKKLWERASTEGTGRLRVLSGPSDLVAIDGQVTERANTVAAGLHLVQAGALPARSRFALVVPVADGGVRRVDVTGKKVDRPAAQGPAGGVIQNRGEVPVQLRHGDLTFTPGMVAPEGAYTIWADFGAGFQDTEVAVAVPKSAQPALRCSRITHQCRALQAND